MIKNTYDNCHRLAEESARAIDLKSLQEFYRISLFESMVNDQKVFEAELENMGIKTQGELDGDDCPVIGGFPLPEDIDE
jgi:hypothetical protein